ncbi:MAG: RNA polymerase sigma factor [Phycisphaerales bacterium]|nr:MAG: RNA polymerase sigma factor [Phycisphaerales bacterium]
MPRTQCLIPPTTARAFFPYAAQVFAASREPDRSIRPVSWAETEAASSTPRSPADLADDADRALVARIQRQEPGAWAELVERYQHRLYAVCVKTLGGRELAADCCQDAFVRLIQKIDRYDGRSRFSTWAIRVTMNICLSRLRSEKLRRHAPLNETNHAQKPGVFTGSAPRTPTGGSGRAGLVEPSGVSGVERGEDARRLGRALADLPDEQRAILLLRDVQGMDYAQIAHALGVAVGTVKSRLFRARRSLRESIEADACHDPPDQPPARPIDRTTSDPARHQHETDRNPHA